MSRLHEVVDVAGDRVTVTDLTGHAHTVSLLAYEGPAPAPGDWLVVHSGFALAPADGCDVAAALAELRSLVPDTTVGREAR
ncbi:MAG TPA: hypothetical protein VE991_06305 [Acidimicrobiales bacterium]|nr:hypothetical protein [Acidimicrobiales bacterium]